MTDMTSRRNTLAARIATIEMNIARDPQARHMAIWQANLAAARAELKAL